MAKILTDKELAEIIHKAVHDDNVIDCNDAYEHFMEDLAQLVCTHFGGEVGTVSMPEYDELGWAVGIHVNDSVPADGGVYKDYDTDVTWKDGEEAA